MLGGVQQTIFSRPLSSDSNEHSILENNRLDKLPPISNS